MEYSITALARLSGISTRTLRWYDAQGLLKPARTADNGYRRYGAAEVDRLQDILYYRALGMPLSRIKAILDDPAFDRLAALRAHLSALESEQERLGALIESVRATISCAERNVEMDDELKFAALKRRAVDWNEASFGPEMREKYGSAEVDAAHSAVLSLTREQYDEWQSAGAEIIRRLEQAVTEQLPPACSQAREIVELHRRWLSFSGTAYSPDMHRGLAALYTSDERFTAYYDRSVPGCAAYLAAAIYRRAGVE